MLIKIRKIRKPVVFRSSLGKIELSNPLLKEVPELIELIKSEDLDLRKLVFTSSDSYPSMGRKKLTELWENEKSKLNLLKNKSRFPFGVVKQISKQALGICMSKNFPCSGTYIKDPFNLAKIEKTISLETMQESQLTKIIIAKKKNQIIGTIRVLGVGRAVEIASLTVRKDYRRNGIAERLIKEFLGRLTTRPFYSIQKPETYLLQFYLREYAKESVSFPSFKALPKTLRRDLLFMNAFWGPYIIMKISGKYFK
jgi:ribosomal protein S18 acetylase RimI-like enzyme